MKGRKNIKYQTCCGQRIKARVIDGKLVKQPHPCNDDSDVRGVDWDHVRNVVKGLVVEKKESA